MNRYLIRITRNGRSWPTGRVVQLPDELDARQEIYLHAVIDEEIRKLAPARRYIAELYKLPKEPTTEYVYESKIRRKTCL